MDGFLRDFRLAVRSYLRRPGFTLVAMLTLGLGIGATTSIFSVVRAVLLEPLPYVEPEALVTLWSSEDGTPSRRGPVAYPQFQAWRIASSFRSMAAFSSTSFTLTGLGEAEVVPGALATPGFFRVFAQPLALGREFLAEEDVADGPAVVIVAHSFWQSRMGSDPRVLDRTVELDGVPHQVVGVAPPGFAFPARARLWRPVQNAAGCGFECAHLSVVGRLAPGASLARARKELGTIRGRLEEVYAPRGDGGVVLVSLHELVVGGTRPGLLIALGAMGVVLLMACANVANLLLARGAERADEMALRSAMGAGRARRVGQLLTESLVLAVGGGIVGVLLALWGVDLLRSVSPPDLPRLDRVVVDMEVLGFAGGLVPAVALLVGLGPALRLAATAPPTTSGGPPWRDGSSRSGPRTGGAATAGRGTPTRREWGRTGLLVMEVALSLVLLVGAGLLMRSFRQLQDVELGFEPRGVLTFGLHLPPERYPTPEDRAAFVVTLRERLEAHGSVEVAGVALGSPLEELGLLSTFEMADRPDAPPGEAPTVLLRLATPEYFRSLRIPLVRGRSFDHRDRIGEPRTAMVSESLARSAWGRKSPLGEEILLGAAAGPPVQVVGVVADVRSSRITEAPRPEVYLSYLQEPSRVLTVHVRALPMTGGVDGLREVVRGEVQALDPGLPLVGLEPLEARVDRALGRPRLHLVLMGFFASAAVALAAVGLYGAMAYLVARRTREIGIRVAMGAEEGHVKILVLREGFLPVLGGIVVGSGGALVVAHVLRVLLYRVEPVDPTTLAGVAAVLLGVAFLASLGPARRAARISPGEALRGG